MRTKSPRCLASRINFRWQEGERRKYTGPLTYILFFITGMGRVTLEYTCKANLHASCKEPLHLPF